MNKKTAAISPMIVALVIAGISFSARTVRAQPATVGDQRDRTIAELKNEIKQLEARVEGLESIDQRVKVIDRKLEVQQEADVAKARDMPVVSVGAQGFSLSSPNPSDYQIKFGGIIQGDGRFFTTGNDKTATGSTFYLNRVRPILSGTLWKYYDFNFTPDFGQGRFVLQDAYVNIKYYKEAQLQAGKMKSPFELERLQSDRDLMFSERGLTTNLSPNRDIGVELHSDLFENRLTYQLAFMNGVPNNTATVDNDSNDGKDFVGRLFTTPFKKSRYQWARGLGLGIAGTYGDERNGTTSVYKTFGQSTWFSYTKGVTASGKRYRWSPQAYYYFGPFGLLGEFVSDTHELNRNLVVKKGKFNDYVNDNQTFTDRGYSVGASYLLTGEDATYYGVKPYHPFDPREGSLGAWELAARIGSIGTDSGQFKLNFVDPSVSAKTATEYALGLNWYLTQNVKWQFAYARTFFDKGAPGGKDRPDEGVFESQLQIAF
jgi:phosphate-selective porin OprO/OprP